MAHDIPWYWAARDAINCSWVNCVDWRSCLSAQQRLVLGNLDSFRDWGYSRDYVEAIKLMMDSPAPADYHVATGQSHSVRELCQIVFSKLGMDDRDLVTQDPKYV